jgi:peptidoglycan/LPS O-acetylase OafA/YrhL
MSESLARERRRWADIVVIVTGLALVGLAAWNGPASSEAPDARTASLPSMYAAYGVGGGLALAAVLVVHRWRTAGRMLLIVAALTLLGFGLDAFQREGGGVWLTILVPALLLLVASPFFGPMPRAARLDRE